MIEAGREYSAQINDIALPSGHGVTRLGGMVVFVPGAVPGDRVRLRVARLRPGFAYGELVTMEEESPDRVRPAVSPLRRLRRLRLAGPLLRSPA